MNALLVLTLAASQTTAWDQFMNTPKQTWINLGICVVALVGIVKAWRALKSINEFVPYIAAVIAAFLIFMYWVYDRSEPRFLTPLVDKLAPFLPSKSWQEPSRRGPGR